MTENLLDPNTTTQGYYERLVGEGRKFKDGDTLAKAKEDSDLYIKSLEQQKDELRADNLRFREELTKKANLEELLDQLEAKQRLAATTPNAVNTDIQKPQQIDPKEIESLVSKSIQTHEMNKTQEQNFTLVKNKLMEKFGDKYQSALKQQVDSLGLTEDYVNDMARKAPSALFRLLGVDAQTINNSYVPPPRSEVAGFTPVIQQDRTWKWYQDLKKSDYKTYSDPKTQVQMHNDAIRLGERFKDGDYAAFD